LRSLRKGRKSSHSCGLIRPQGTRRSVRTPTLRANSAIDLSGQ